MFDFHKLNVYQVAQDLSRKIHKYLQTNTSIDPELKDQLTRASHSIVLNIAEGTGRFSKADRSRFYKIARGSAYECVAITEILKLEGHLDDKTYEIYYEDFERISKMLFGLIKRPL